MAENPLYQAQRLGMQAVNDLGVLFGRLGTSAHPNSATLVAYRNANRALRDALKTGGGLPAVRDITSQLRATVKPSVTRVFQDAASQGYKNSAAQLRLYKVETPGEPGLQAHVDAAYRVIDANLQTQEAAITALMLSGSDETLITGDENRQGVLKAATIITAAAFWTAALWWDAFSTTADRAGGGFSKQAVAAIDARTTDCCLRVHGQVQPLNGAFHLTGTPRFADDVEWPPFHYWCRTSGVLYLPGYDDGLTDLMRSSASQVLAERAAGLTIDRHPADAFI